jgi:hypothetical protein
MLYRDLTLRERSDSMQYLRLRELRDELDAIDFSLGNWG